MTVGHQSTRAKGGQMVALGQLLVHRLRRILKPALVEIRGCALIGNPAAARCPDHIRPPAVYVAAGGYILVGGGTASPRQSRLLLRDGMWIRALDDGGFLIEMAP